MSEHQIPISEPKDEIFVVTALAWLVRQSGGVIRIPRSEFELTMEAGGRFRIDVDETRVIITELGDIH